MGYVIIEVEDARGEELIKEALAALKHQIEVALLTEAVIKTGSEPGEKK